MGHRCGAVSFPASRPTAPTARLLRRRCGTNTKGRFRPSTLENRRLAHTIASGESPTSPLSHKPTPRFRAWLIPRCLLEHLIVSYEFTSEYFKGEKYEDRTKSVHKIFGIYFVGSTDIRRGDCALAAHEIGRASCRERG